MNAVLERINVEQFIASLSSEELACVAGLLLQWEQKDLAQLFGVSPSTITRTMQRIQMKFVAWNG